MKCIIEIDDLHPNPEVDCLDVAEDLLNKNPSLVLNFFVPTCYKGYPLSLDKDWCNRLRILIDSDRICLGIHGHLHEYLEFKSLSYQEAVSSIKASESILNSAGLSYSKTFRGPYWAINEPTCDALFDLGYTHLYSHKDYDHLNTIYLDKFKICYYSWNLKDDYGKFENSPTDVIVGHGHSSKHSHLNCSNGLNDVSTKIELFIKEYNPIFLRLDEYA